MATMTEAPRQGLGPMRAGLVVLILGLSGLAAALHYGGASALAVFIVAGVALGGLAWIVSFSTEAVGERFGPSITGLLNSTLGNLPELFVVLFALSAGEVVVAQTSILGSLFANALFVLGLTFVVGAQRSQDGIMRFGTRLPNDEATLLLLVSFIIVILGVSDQIGDRASRHQVPISVVGAIVLLLVYGTWLVRYLREDSPPGAEEIERSGLGFVPAIVLLAVGAAGAALVSEYFVNAIDGATEQLGISKAFTGLVIVALAGNAVEHVVGIVLAAKGKSELAVSVVKHSVAQIAAFLFPALVLISLLFEHRLTFVAGPVYIAALALMAIAIWQVTGDGEATAFEGWALVGFYAVLATLAFYE
jgi:Ca2+:H+ antiporter